jgi:hypothetical protein
MRLLREVVGVVLIVSIFAATGCGADPEQLVRDRIEEARIAAEAGDLKALGAMLAQDFVDDRGNDRAAVLAMVGYYVRVEGGLHIWTRIDGIEISGSGEANVHLLVALASGPIESLQDLTRLRAEVHRFTLTLVEADRGDWQLTHATWARASLADVM